MKSVLFSLSVLSAVATGAGTCIISGSLDRPLAGTTTSASGMCATAVETGDCSRGEPAETVPLDVVERTTDDGHLAGAFSSFGTGLMIIVR